MRKYLLRNITALLAVMSSCTAVQAQLQIGTDINGEAASDQSGYSVSMPDAVTIAIGAPRNDGTGNNAGHVRVYSWTGSLWTQKGADIDGEAANDQSGYSVSMPDANTVAIGAPFNDGTGSNAGHVRVYSWNGSAWIQKGADINGEAASDQSGISVSMPDANTVAIGANLNDGMGTNSGHVRVYTWNGSSWVQRGIDINGEAANDQSGVSVSMPDATTVAIGANLNDGTGSNSGHVRVYSWNGSAWVQKGIDINGEAANDQSGYSVSMPDAVTVAIGAPYNTGSASSSGHTRVYSWNGSAWVQKGIDINGEAATDRSGFSVSMPDAGTVAIGANLNDGPPTDAGHVRVYSWNGSAWTQTGTDINGEAATDQSGFSVSMPDAVTVGIGAPLNDGAGSNSGHVRAYHICAVTVTASATPGTICGGSSSSLSASGASTYTWMPGSLSGSPLAVTPASTTTYTVTGADAFGCTGTASVTVVVNIPPSVSASASPATICGGSSTTLTASGASTYNWMPGSLSGSSVTASPASTTTYTVTGTDVNGCTGTANVTVTVNTPPTVSASATPAVICSGSSSALAASGASTYDWMPGNLSGASVSVSPASTTTYTVTGTDANGCTGTANVTLTVNTPPTVSASASPATICGGGSTTLTASGASTYDWMPGSLSGSSVSISPASTTTYTVTGTDVNGCTGTANVTVTVNTPPVVSSSASPGTICSGSSTTLSASGATTYGWVPGNLSGASVSVAPGSTTTYTVTGTDANGCSATSNVTVTVNASPVVSASGSPTSICNGNSSTLSASGANSYNWMPGSLSGSSVSITPLSTTTYTVTGTDLNGCTGSSNVTIVVNNCAVSSLPCGQTYNRMGTSVSAANVPGALNYRFTFYDNTTNAVISQVTQASRTLALNTVPNIYYNQTYKWSVAVDQGFGFGAESNTNCTISFGLPTTTVPCGNTYSTINTYSNVSTPGNVVGYRFTLYNATTNAVYAQRTQTSNYIYFNTFSPLPVLGTSYKWTVALQYALPGGGTAFGPESNMNCLINFSAPVTTVPCNMTYNKATGYTACPAIGGGIGYRFTFYQGSTMVAQVAQTSNYIYFNQVAAISNGNTYTWTVEVRYNGASGPAYGPASTPCPITFSATAREINPDIFESQEEPVYPAQYGDPVEISIYPNPTEGQITINTPESVRTVHVFSMTGALLRTYACTKDITLEDLPTGTYMLVVQTTEGVRRATVIKE